MSRFRLIGRSAHRITGRWPAVALVVIVAALAAAACGSDTGDRERQVVPDSVDFALAANLDAGRNGAWHSARATLRRVPMIRLLEPEVPTPDTIVDTLLVLHGGERLDYDTDVRPWLGYRGGIAGSADAGERGASHTDALPDLLVWARVTDDDAARAALERSFGDADEREFDGETLFIAGDAVYAIADGTLVLSRSRRLIERALAAHDDGALHESDAWRSLDDVRSPGGQLASLFVSRSGAAYLRRSLQRLEPDAAAAVRKLAGDRTAPMLLEAGVDDAGAWLDIATAPAARRGVVIATEEVEPAAATLLEQLPDTDGLLWHVSYRVRKLTIDRQTVLQAVSLAARISGKPAATARSHPLLTVGRSPGLEVVHGMVDGAATSVVRPRVPAGVSRTGTVGARREFQRAMDHADPPAEALEIGWVDAGRVAAAVFEPLSSEVAHVAAQQLRHSGGVVYWSTTTGAGDSLVDRCAVRLPLYG